MPTIAGFGFNAWAGILAYGGPKMSLFEQGGVSGYGVVIGGLKTPPQTIHTLYRATSAGDAFSTLNAYRSTMFAYSPVTVIDQFGAEFDQVLIMDVVATAAIDPLGYMVNATWSLLLQSN